MAAKPTTKSDAAQADTAQADATQPRPVDATGRTLDQWGLPLSGPARLAALDGKPDPALDADATPAPVSPATPTDKD
ncbi:hypothetical protein I6G65_15925 [Sphingomonas paucimobilis]|uniref:DNA, contig: SP630 n=1 Tax=Sphingomonas paucimobilis NBRC 13935 TaxID=1219050 RepID=A0A0C9MTX7_SPHPI|nr:hypothetical protein [Sphingomonas paucimobilis]QPS15780.1 hypothetical protein I6G65_15925 [Sphingomonas paucimobilis]GAN14151.1 hypothetical protein SP6_30_02920 [Sphingomonas paucimobilis NBRC 13935]SUJ08110.1 Uncharacterised protein [Sphingomonas paucimobilis]